MSLCANRSKVKQQVMTEIMGVVPLSQGPAQGFGVAFLLPWPVVSSSGSTGAEVAGAPCPMTQKAFQTFAPSQPEALCKSAVAPIGQQQSCEHRRGGIRSTGSDNL